MNVLIRVDKGIVTVVGGDPTITVHILDMDCKDYFKEVVLDAMDEQDILNYVNTENNDSNYSY